MIDKQKGVYVFECDGCAEVLDAGTSYFPIALEYLREKHWRATKVGDVWKHYCPECK